LRRGAIERALGFEKERIEAPPVAVSPGSNRVRLQRGTYSSRRNERLKGRSGQRGLPIVEKIKRAPLRVGKRGRRLVEEKKTRRPINTGTRGEGRQSSIDEETWEEGSKGQHMWFFFPRRIKGTARQVGDHVYATGGKSF